MTVATEAGQQAPRQARAREKLPETLPLLERALPAEEVRLVKGDDGHARITFSCSSETPCDRWYGEEVLSHDGDAIRMDRLTRGACPLLFNHSFDDPIGMIEGARIERKRLVVDAKLFKTARAEEIATMIDGGLRNVSLMYRVHVYEQDMDEERYTATDWEVYEVSIVTVPADATVGIGRSQSAEQFEFRTVGRPPAAITSVPTTAPSARSNAMTDQVTAPAGPSADTQVRIEAGRQQPGESASALQLETQRRQAIINLCQANNIQDNVRNLWITAGTSMEKVSEELLAIMKQRGESNPKSESVLGLTPRETKRFSLQRAISAIADNNWNNAGFEAECSRAIGQRIGRTQEPNKFFVPYEVQQRSNESQTEMLARLLMKRDLAVSGSAGVLVETMNWSFIEILRNITVLYAMGATRLTGLQGNVSIPKQSTAATPYWLGTEATQITESQQAFTQINMSPKNVGGYTEVSRQLLLQSNPSAESLIMADLAAVVGIEIDRVGFNGSGVSGQPLGILQTSGIGSVTGTSLDYADIIEFMTDCAAANALWAAAGYVTTPVVAGLLMARVKYSNTASPIWEGMLQDGTINNYRAMATNNVPTASMLFGDYSKTVIGEWGVLEIEVNPYANFQAGIIGIRAMASIDVAVRYPVAYSAASSIT
jgi:HK97 family phage major capsid protein/HK97 family phage prohead protease